MHILVIDRCKRLTYQLIEPWSTVNYPYVKAAILSTFIDKPCGECIKTSGEASASSASITNHDPLSRYETSWKISETNMVEDKAIIGPLVVNDTYQINTLGENMNSTIMPMESGPFVNVTCYAEENAEDYYRYSTLAQQKNENKVNETQNVLSTNGTDIHSYPQESNSSSHNISEYVSRLPGRETDNTVEKKNINESINRNTLKENLTTSDTDYYMPENRTVPLISENLPKHEYFDQSVTKVVNVTTAAEEMNSTTKPHSRHRTEPAASSSLNETKIKHRKYIPNKYKPHQIKKYEDQITPPPKKKSRKHHRVKEDNTKINTTTESPQEENQKTAKPTEQYNKECNDKQAQHKDNKCKQEPPLLEKVSSRADPAYPRSTSTQVPTEATTTDREPVTIGFEENVSGRNALEPGIDLSRNKIVKSPNHDRNALDQKSTQYLTIPKFKEEMINTTLVGRTPQTPVTRCGKPPRLNQNIKAPSETFKHTSTVVEERMQTETVEATEEETIKQYEKLVTWLDYTL